MKIIHRDQLTTVVIGLSPKTRKMVTKVVDKVITDIELNPLVRVSALPINSETETVLEFLGRTIFRKQKTKGEIIGYQSLTHFKCFFSKEDVEDINLLSELLNEQPFLFKHKGILINTKGNLIQYQDKKPISIHKKTKSIRFIILLFSRKSVKYEEITKQLDLNSDYGDRQSRLTELHKYRKMAEDELIKAYVPENIARSIFESDRNVGFSLSP